MARHIIKRVAIVIIAVLAVFAISCGNDDTQYRKAVQESIEEAKAEVEQQQTAQQQAAEVEQQQTAQQQTAEVEQQQTAQQQTAEVEQQQTAQQQATQQESDGIYTESYPPERIKRYARLTIASSILQEGFSARAEENDIVRFSGSVQASTVVLDGDSVFSNGLGGWICEIELQNREQIIIEQPEDLNTTRNIEWKYAELLEAGPEYRERLFHPSLWRETDRYFSDEGDMIVRSRRNSMFIYIFFEPTTALIRLWVEAEIPSGRQFDPYCSSYSIHSH